MYYNKIMKYVLIDKWDELLMMN